MLRSWSHWFCNESAVPETSVYRCVLVRSAVSGDLQGRMIVYQQQQGISIHSSSTMLFHSMMKLMNLSIELIEVARASRDFVEVIASLHSPHEKQQNHHI
jgi:hypothetical protein